MIITVTMNPAVDKTVDVEQLKCGELNRLNNVITDAAGKGINVSKTILSLGGVTTATGFIGGNTGIYIEETLKNMGIECDFVHTQTTTRTNLKVVEKNGCVTELNELGNAITDFELNNLIVKLESYANKDTLFVFAGSVPNNIDRNIYKILIEKVKSKGAKVFLDADGELFVNAIETIPSIIKPNRFELESLYNLDHKANEDELIHMGTELLNKGIEMVVISLGSEGALFLNKDKIVKCPPIKVQTHSTVGAGDAMVAALSYSIDKNMSFECCVKLAMATSAGAVTTKGTKPPDLELIKQLEKQVIIKPFF